MTRAGEDEGEAITGVTVHFLNAGARAFLAFPSEGREDSSQFDVSSQNHKMR